MRRRDLGLALLAAPTLIRPARAEAPVVRMSKQYGLGYMSMMVMERQNLIERHADYTQSTRARQILAAWDQYVPKFVKVMPKDYKRMLASIDRAQAQGLTGDEAIMAAFEDNARDLSRVGGN